MSAGHLVGHDYLEAMARHEIEPQSKPGRRRIEMFDLVAERALGIARVGPVEQRIDFAGWLADIDGMRELERAERICPGCRRSEHLVALPLRQDSTNSLTIRTLGPAPASRSCLAGSR